MDKKPVGREAQRENWNRYRYDPYHYLLATAEIPVIGRAIGIIRKRFDKSLPIEDLARQVGIGQTRILKVDSGIRRLFTQSVIHGSLKTQDSGIPAYFSRE